MSENKQSRYASLAKAIMKHAIIVNSGLNEIIELEGGHKITLQEWLVAETVVEQRDEYNNMVELSRKIGIPPSSFFRIISHLQKAGLVDKYHIQGNKKSVVLRPTKLALELYSKRTTSLRKEIWSGFAKALERFSDSDIEAFTEAINQLNASLPSARLSQEIELIKID